ncbi:MAG: HEAT repeat domain-containing protein [Gemmatimonadales bacterium]|nr:HEAT repeat domain-containing protein [Gemmatimonadales bacterium]
MPTILPILAGWLLTYALHSTVLLGLAWLILRTRRTDARTRDVLWKVAMVGGIVTASVQTALDLRPAGTVSLVAAAEPATPSQAADRSTQSKTAQIESGAEVAPPAGERSATTPVVSAPTTAAPSSTWFTPALTIVWVVLAAALLAWYLGRRLILVGRLGDRRVIADGDLPSVLGELRTAAGVRQRVRLTASQTIASPVALGRSEICLPAAALVELEPAEQRAMLAHELAHLVRHDPSWLVVACLIERAFFFQPLNRLAREGIQDAAEFLADEWAARRTGGVPLARALVKVAEWLQASPLGVPVAGFAEERSRLTSRVGRLLEPEAARGTGSGRVAVFASVGALAVMTTVAPGISGRAAAPAPSEPVTTELAAPLPVAPAEDPVASATPEASQPPRTEAIDAAREAGLAMPAGTAWADTAIVRALMGRLRDEDAGVRRAAADALGRIEHPMAIPALVAAIGDPDRDVRHAVVDALASFDGGVPAAPIRALLSDADTEIRQHAIEMLGEMQDRGAVGAITALASDADPEVRREVMYALGEIGDPASVAVLRRGLGDADADVRESALEALTEMDQPIDVAIVRTLLADPNPDTRHRALHLAADQKLKELAGPVAAMLDDDNPDVRQQALYALDEMEAPIAVGVIQRGLRDDNPDVRQTAIHIAGNRRMVAVATDITVRVTDPNPDVRQTALHALHEMQAEIAPSVVVRALADDNADVRQTAAWVAGDLRLTAATDALVRLLDDGNGDVRESAAEALTEMRSDAARAALRRAMTHADPDVRRVAVEFFGEERKP